ncbi:alpha/beta fold hydrolase [Bosea sp. 2KB_26]|uniref:alpha/beta fold hydrolase n=1 Tax=Bosea sp. 2KB_26 TaxID=3237475 RepID=UPI003F9302A2
MPKLSLERPFAGRQVQSAMMDFPPDTLRFEVPCGEAFIKCYDSDPARTSTHTIVLLHGSAGTAAGSFWALLPMLARRHRVVAFDFIDPIDPTDAGEFYMEQALAVASAAVDTGPVDLLGYSFGAVIAAKIAARVPDRVRSLVLVAGWAKTDAQQLLRNDVWNELHEAGSPALGKFSVLTTYGQYFVNSRTPEELSSVIASNSNGELRTAKMKFNRSVDIVSDIEAIRAPTLVVGCEYDQTAPIRHAHMLFGGIADARLFEMKTGHGVVHERPAELAAVAGDFVVDPSRHAAGAVIANEHA